MTYTKVVIRDSRRTEATKWAKVNFGLLRGQDGNLRWHEMIWYSQELKSGGTGFYFRNPDHASWFMLRWS